MALTQRNVSFFFLRRASLVVRSGFFLLGLGKAPVNGAAIFELDPPLLYVGFLDLELGQSRLDHAKG